MARQKSIINSVDLTRALKAARAVGLTITSTKVGPDGTITLGHVLEGEVSEVDSADHELARWEAKRYERRSA